MANRRLYQFQYSFERDLVQMYCQVAIGAAGVPTISNNKGIKSIVRNSAGDYTINLMDNYNLLMDINASVQNATGIPVAPLTGIKANSVSSATAPSVEVVFSTGGVATDPANGDKLFISIVCRNSST